MALLGHIKLYNQKSVCEEYLAVECKIDVKDRAGEREAISTIITIMYMQQQQSEQGEEKHIRERHCEGTNEKTC